MHWQTLIDKTIEYYKIEPSERKGKLIVSGACNSSKLAPFFLKAGATAVIAPEFPVSWPNLGRFFCLFYEALFSGREIAEALKLALVKFPEYGCYQVHRSNL